jgi:hypothetical protein
MSNDKPTSTVTLKYIVEYTGIRGSIASAMKMAGLLPPLLNKADWDWLTAVGQCSKNKSVMREMAKDLSYKDRLQILLFPEFDDHMCFLWRCFMKALKRGEPMVSQIAIRSLAKAHPNITPYEAADKATKVRNAIKNVKKRSSKMREELRLYFGE